MIFNRIERFTWTNKKAKDENLVLFRVKITKVNQSLNTKNTRKELQQKIVNQEAKKIKS